MERQRYKRLNPQIGRHTTKNPSGFSNPVPEVSIARPQTLPRALSRPTTIDPIMARPIAKPIVAAPIIKPIAAAPRISPISKIIASQVEPAQMVQPRQIRVPAIDMSLPGDESPSRFSSMVHGAKARRLRKAAFRTVAVSLVLLITMGGLLISQTLSKTNKVFQGSTGTATALKKNVDPELLKGEGSGRINVLLLGKGGGNHDAPDLTDTIILASVDPINHTSTLLSIPRDLWVTVPQQGVMKLNAAWQTGAFKHQGNTRNNPTDPATIQAGFDTINATVGNALGVNIDYDMLLNFEAFSQAIDTVSGVNVTVPADLVDPTMAWENANNPVLAKAGPQVFGGKQALLYVRSRETSSDFARGQRQRSVMLALKDKIDSLGTLSNPLKLSGLLNAFGNNVSTNLSLSNANRLYGITKQVTDANTTSIGLADGANPLVTTGNQNGQSIVLPKAGLFNYAPIQAYVRDQLKNPYLVAEKAKILVLNGSTLAGLATAKAEELKSFGYTVTGTANTPNSGWTHTTLVDMTAGKKKYTKHYLEEHYGLTALNKMPDETIPTNGADFVMIIGSDEANITQTKAH